MLWKENGVSKPFIALSGGDVTGPSPGKQDGLGQGGSRGQKQGWTCARIMEIGAISARRSPPFFETKVEQLSHFLAFSISLLPVPSLSLYLFPKHLTCIFKFLLSMHISVLFLSLSMYLSILCSPFLPLVFYLCFHPSFYLFFFGICLLLSL